MFRKLTFLVLLFLILLTPPYVMGGEDGGNGCRIMSVQLGQIGLAYDGSGLGIISDGGPEVKWVNMTTGVVEKTLCVFETGSFCQKSPISAYGLAWDSKDGYLAVADDHAIHLVRPDTGEEIAVIEVGLGQDIIGLDYDPLGDSFWFNRGEGWTKEISRSGEVLTTLPVGESMVGVAVRGRCLYHGVRTSFPMSFYFVRTSKKSPAINWSSEVQYLNCGDFSYDFAPGEDGLAAPWCPYGTRNIWYADTFLGGGLGSFEIPDDSDCFLPISCPPPTVPPEDHSLMSVKTVYGKTFVTLSWLNPLGGVTGSHVWVVLYKEQLPFAHQPASAENWMVCAEPTPSRSCVVDTADAELFFYQRRPACDSYEYE